MEHLQYYIEATDGTRIFVRQWAPDDKPRARVILIHGFSEHSGRYSEWAERFVNQGISVLAPDLRGHGKSHGLRGHTPSFKQLLRDMDQLLYEHTQQSHLPTFLYGQSLGGDLVINYGITRSNGYHGIIATAPWLKLSTEPRAFALLLSRALKIIAPRAVKNSRLDINYLSHNPEVIRRYEADPLTHRQITPNLFFGARKAGYQAIKKAARIQHPILIMHGTGDKITSLRASHQLARNAQKAGVDAQFIPWEGLYHELHNELENEQIFQAILAWLNQQLEKTTAL